MERGSPPESLATSARRVSSPSAENTRAGTLRRAAAPLRLLRDILFNVLHLHRPAAIVHAERLGAAVARNLVESGLGEDEQGAIRGFLQPKFDESGRFLRVIDFRVDPIRMPGERKKPLGLHFLNDGVPIDVLVSRVGDVAGGGLARDERAVQLDAKPRAEFAMIGQRAPDARNGRLEFDALFDSVL